MFIFFPGRGPNIENINVKNSYIHINIYIEINWCY